MATLIFCLLGANSRADIESGADLLAQCRDERHAGACVNYLISLSDLHDAFAAWGAFARQWCMPPDVPPRRLRDVVTAYLEAHAEDRQLPATELVGSAYAEAFPCAE